MNRAATGSVPESGCFQLSLGVELEADPTLRIAQLCQLQGQARSGSARSGLVRLNNYSQMRIQKRKSILATTRMFRQKSDMLLVSISSSSALSSSRRGYIYCAIYLLNLSHNHQVFSILQLLRSLKLPHSSSISPSGFPAIVNKCPFRVLLFNQHESHKNRTPS